MIRRGHPLKDSDVLVLGLTLNADCADLRNSKVIDVIRELQSYGARVHVHDPIASPEEALHEYGVQLVKWDDLPRACAIVGAVAHQELVSRTPSDLLAKLAPQGVYVDVKCKADKAALNELGVEVWRL